MVGIVEIAGSFAAPLGGSEKVEIMAKDKTESKVKPKYLGKAGKSQPANAQPKRLSGSKAVQPQNRITETRQGMPRLGYKRKGIVLPDEMIRELKHRAVDLGITDSELVERAVRAFLETGAGNS